MAGRSNLQPLDQIQVDVVPGLECTVAAKHGREASNAERISD